MNRREYELRVDVGGQHVLSLRSDRMKKLQAGNLAALHCCRVAATAARRNRLLRCEIIIISPSLRFVTTPL